MKTIYDPTRTIEINPTGAVSGTVYKLQSFRASQAPATNQTAVAAVTGYIVRVFSIEAQSVDAAMGTLLFKSNSGGAGLWGAFRVPLATTAGVIHLTPFNPLGWFETTVSQGLFYDVADDDVNFVITYIQYKP